MLPRLTYLLGYLGLSTSTGRKVNDVLGGGLISGYPGMGQRYVPLLIKKGEENATPGVPLNGTRVLATVSFVTSLRRTFFRTLPSRGHVPCVSFGWLVRWVGCPWRVVEVENSQKDRCSAALEVVIRT